MQTIRTARASRKQTRATAPDKACASVADYERYTLYAGLIMAALFGLCFWL